MDQFAFHDVPDSIDYILETTSQPSLSYIGFSQGTAQAFATLSIHPTLNDKIDVFIALAPAMSPAGLFNGVVNSLIKASPGVIFLAFGRRSILSSATMWQALLYPPIFVRIIDMSLFFLFGWTASNISTHQKLAAYPHLYSFTSTKSVVHWFQIIRNKSFQMYDDDVQAPLSLVASDRYYKVAKFPTRNIKTPIVLVYGGSDSLVDIKVMLKELPRHTVAKEIPHFEHLDFLWAQDVDTLVFPYVFASLEEYAGRDHIKSRSFHNRLMGRSPLAVKTSGYSEDGFSSPDNRASDAENNGSRSKISTGSQEKLSAPLLSSFNPSPPSSSSTDFMTLSNDEVADSPTPAGPKTASASLVSNAKHKGNGWVSSTRSADSASGIKMFGNTGISIGPAKAMTGGVVSPPVRDAGKRRKKSRHSSEIDSQHSRPAQSHERITQPKRFSCESATQYDGVTERLEPETPYNRQDAETGAQHNESMQNQDLGSQNDVLEQSQESGSLHDRATRGGDVSAQYGSPVHCSPAVPAVDFAKHSG